LNHWVSTITDDEKFVGTALLLETTPKFYEEQGEKETKLSWYLVFQYLIQSKWQIVQIFIALLITSLLQLVFPFLAQSVVDTGINTQNMGYVTIILIAQLMLLLSKSTVDFIRNRLLLKVSVIVNLSILSDFWIKLTRLPLAYFDNHHTGDTLQRIGDNKQIQEFLMGTALNTLFSMLSLIVFAFILAIYQVQLFFIFGIGSFLYWLWILLFLRIRRTINYQIFHLAAKENNATLQLVQGMQEIRLHNAEQFKRWEWERIQAGISKLNIRNLNYSQFQQAGALLINQGKDILITFIVAQLVIQGKLTFGAMLAVQYIIGQLSSPIEQLIGFIQRSQDAKISMERLNEVHALSEEERPETPYIVRLPENKSINLKGVSFAYPGNDNESVLNNINLKIPEGKVTAIVGVSGSGKTTLLKLLLKFYDIQDGEIKVGETNFNYIRPAYWRSQCGAVLQDGYIFNDTIARNITLTEEFIYYEKLIECCRIANILSFIESLPNGFHTRLGSEGIGLSQGQKQRLLIARVVYKNPQYLFFDEATNALDANNERVIVENMKDFFKNRTVVVIAHRLSTIKNADNIIVLDNGSVVEEGTHSQLSLSNGRYFELVKNQLELGN
jgi:ATP-binding cassette subfamily B protein